MQQHRTSLKDLAERLGVSIATVSRALRNSHEVGEEMKQRVQQLAKELNYRPNPFAQSLRKEAPRIIGVVVPNLVTHYYAAVLDGIEDFARTFGYTVICSNSHEDHTREEQAIDNFINLHVEGIIACLAQDTTDYSHFKEIHDMGIPLVFFARTCLPELFSQVVADGDVAAHSAAEHLIATGSRRIAFIGGPNHLDMVRRRKHGYLQALREHNIPIDRNLVKCGDISYDFAEKAVDELMGMSNPPDAIIAFNDIVTFGAFKRIQERGLSIPGDVAIIGFTDSDTASFVTPKVTVVADQASKQGKVSCDLLFRAIRGDKKIYKEVVPMQLHIQDSSDKSRAKGI